MNLYFQMQLIYKLLALLFILGILALLINWIFIPSYQFTYYESRDGRNCLTKLRTSGWDGEQIYLINGRYAEKEIPRTYIHPKFSGFQSGFETLVDWSNDTCIVYAYYGVYIDGPVQDAKLKFVPLMIPGLGFEEWQRKRVNDRFVYVTN